MPSNNLNSSLNYQNNKKNKDWQVDYKKTILEKALLCHIPISYRPEGGQEKLQIVIGLYDQNQKIQNLLKQHSSLLWGIYDAQVLRKMKGDDGKVFINLSSSPQEKNGDAMMNHAEKINEGDRVIVQVVRDAFQDKGMQVTSRIKFQGRYLDFWPSFSSSGREQGKSGDNKQKKQNGFAIELTKDLGQGLMASHLLKLFEQDERLLAKANEKNAISGKLVLKGAMAVLQDEMAIDFALQIVEEAKAVLHSPKIEFKGQQKSIELLPPLNIGQEMAMMLAPMAKIQVQDWQIMAWIEPILNKYAPDLLSNVEIMNQAGEQFFVESGMADAWDEQTAIEILLHQGCKLKIEKTHALNVIDIDMAQALGQSQLSSLSLNLSALPEIVRQIRLRDLGGLIIIDPLKSDLGATKQKAEMQIVIEKLRSYFKYDEVKTDILGVTAGGVIEIIRQRRKNLS